MSSILSHLLAHHLAQNSQVPAALSFIKQVINQDRAINRALQQEGVDGPVVHRWHLRLSSLIAPSLPSPVRAAGFELLTLTFLASAQSLTAHSKSALTSALNIVSSPKTVDAELYLSAQELVLAVLERSVRHPEWARENVGAQTVQRAVNAFVAVAKGDWPALRLSALAAITQLLPTFPTALRPLNPALHSLAISLLCDEGRSYAERESGSSLFGSLYLLAPKGAQGLRESWKMGAEALIGSIDSLVVLVTADVFSEDPTMNHTLAPLSLPTLPSNSPMVALSRLEDLSSALLFLLRTPVSERAGFVPVPLGALSELGCRLAGLARDTPVKERTDPATLELVYTLLPRLQTAGCQLLAQTALAAKLALLPHAGEVLSTISRTLGTWPVRSPMRPVLSTTYALVAQCFGGAFDPEEGRKSLARVWRSLLEDVGAVAVDPAAPAAGQQQGGEGKQAGSGGGGNGRKNKRTRAFDPAELDLQASRVYLDPIDLAIAERALASLERLLRCPAYYHLPPKLVLATSRLLLALALDPAFFAPPPSGPAERGVDLARRSAVFRRGIVKALAAAVEAGGSEGLIDRAAGVWGRAVVDGDEEVRSVATAALGRLASIIHPVLPPFPAPDPAAKLRKERVGGGVGDDISIQEGAQEFAPKEEVEEDDEDSSDDEAEEMQVEQEVGVAPAAEAGPAAVAAPAPTFQSSTFASSGFGAGAAVFSAATAAVVVPEKKEEDRAEEEAEADSSDEELPVPVAAAAAPAPVAAKKAVAAEEADSSDDEDEAMPTIVMSDDE